MRKVARVTSRGTSKESRKLKLPLSPQVKVVHSEVKAFTLRKKWDQQLLLSQKKIRWVHTNHCVCDIEA